MLIFKIQSLKTKAIWVSICMLAALSFLGKTSSDVSEAFQATKHIDQLNSNLRKQLILNRIASHLGYGGAIHQFKDYEIRRKDSFHARALSQLAAVRTLIDAYRDIGAVSKEENEQLNTLSQLEDMMTSGLLPIKQMISERISSSDIDSEIAIDFAPYQAALAALFRNIQNQSAASLQPLASSLPQLATPFASIEADMRSIGTIYTSMGYAGVIHLFKNYLLHPNSNVDMVRFRQLTKQATTAISQLSQSTALYHTPKPSAEHSTLTSLNDTLDRLSQLPKRYNKAIQKASDLHHAGKSFRSMVRKSKVKEDKNYIHDLNTLNQVLVQQFLYQQRQSQAYLEDVVTQSQQLQLVSFAVLLICILLAIFLFAIQVPRLISKSIAAVAMVTGQESSDLLSLTRRQDEFGKLARTIEASGAILVAKEQQRQEQLEVERVQLEQQQKQERSSQRKQMADDFEATLGKIISDIDQQVEFAKQRAVEVTIKSEQLMRQSSLVREDSRHGIVLVESTEHASSDLQDAIINMGDKTTHASHIASQAMEDTKEINTMIRRLDDVSRRVESVVNSISYIAVNTRVLAMNATIEAASAGEAGKGFAVVAHEVKELAAESSQAVKNIAEEMAYMQQEISATSTLLQNTANKIKSIHQGTETVAASVDTQVDAIRSMNHDAHAASSSMQGIITIMQTLSDSAGESEQASTMLCTAIEEVHARTSDAKVQLHQFLHHVRNT